MTQRIDTVVFDIGNVLIQWDPRNLYRKIFPDSERIEWFLTHVCSPDWNLKQDLGRDWATAEAELVERFPQLANEIRAFRARWSEMVPGPVPGMPEMFDAVGAAGYRRFAVSNFAADTFEIAAGRMPFLRDFDDIALSGRLGVAKPDAAIYQALIQRTGLNPARAIFVDDVMDNVLAADDLGFNAVMFESADQFAGALAERGVSLSTLTNVA